MNKGSVEKWLMAGPGQGTFKMNVEHTVGPETEEVVSEKKEEVYSKRPQEST